MFLGDLQSNKQGKGCMFCVHMEAGMASSSGNILCVTLYAWHCQHARYTPVKLYMFQ